MINRVLNLEMIKGICTLNITIIILVYWKHFNDQDLSLNKENQRKTKGFTQRKCFYIEAIPPLE